jgi:hypothetical protein
MRVGICLVLLAAAALSAPAAAAQGPPDPLGQPVVANLDGDPEPETLLARELVCYRDGEEVPPPCQPDDPRELMPAIQDTCNGQPVTHDLFSQPGGRVVPVEHITRARVFEADGDSSRPEVFVQGFAGATGRVGEAVLVRMMDTPGGCPAPRRLFHHPDPAFDGRRMRGGHPAMGTVRIKDYVRRYRGRELRVVIPFYRRTDAGCCPSMRKTVSLRYDRRRDLYRRYSTRANRRVRARG